MPFFFFFFQGRLEKWKISEELNTGGGAGGGLTWLVHFCMGLEGSLILLHSNLSLSLSISSLSLIYLYPHSLNSTPTCRLYYPFPSWRLPGMDGRDRYHYLFC